MRGRIIHYNASDGKGLVVTGQQQHAFEITQWRSESAPALNQTVELVFQGERLASVARIADDVLLKEKAGALADRIGTAGAATLEGIRQRNSHGLAGRVTGLGKVLPACHALFAASALLFSYLKVEGLFGPSQAYSLVGLSRLSEQLGSAIGGSVLPWLAILSIAVPLFWRSRWAWLALLLPLFATVKPWFDVFSAVRAVSKGMNQFDAGMGRAMTSQLIDMLGIGLGFWLCLATSLVLAGLAVKRTLLPPRPHAEPESVR